MLNFVVFQAGPIGTPIEEKRFSKKRGVARYTLHGPCPRVKIRCAGVARLKIGGWAGSTRTYSHLGKKTFQ